MKIDVHVYMHDGLSDASANRKLLETILARLNQLTAQETQQMKTIEQVKAEIQARIDQLAANVAEQTTVEQSIEALLNGQTARLEALRQQLADALANNGIPDDAAAGLLASLDAQIAADKAITESMKAAVVANTEPA